jgi:hypothetical protein
MAGLATTPSARPPSAAHSTSCVDAVARKIFIASA